MVQGDTHSDTLTFGLVSLGSCQEVLSWFSCDLLAKWMFVHFDFSWALELHMMMPFELRSLNILAWTVGAGC